MSFTENCFLVEFQQEHNLVRVAVFKAEEEAEAFLKLIPGYVCEQEDLDFGKTRYLDPDRIPLYIEIPLGEGFYPMTCYMFDPGVRVDIELHLLPFLPSADQREEQRPPTAERDSAERGEKGHRSLLSGATRVDAYVIPNWELESYLKKREAVYLRLQELAAQNRIDLERVWRGSEDGEAVIRIGAGGESHFLTHMDPQFVDMADCPRDEFEAWWQELLGVN